MKPAPPAGFNKTIQEVWEWYAFQSHLSNSAKSEILRHAAPEDPAYAIFVGLTPEEIEDFFRELDYVAMLDLLAAAEATIRMDFINRVHERRKDSVSRRFRRIHADRAEKVRLEEDILEAWRKEHPETKSAVGDFKGVLNLRDWLAHGRYWIPKLGKDYTPEDVFDIADDLLVQIEQVAGEP